MGQDAILPPLNTAAFLINLALTVLLLGLSFWSGRRGRRRLHYGMVTAFLVTLAAAVVQAEIYGRGFRFDPVRLGIHLACAFLAIALVPVAIVTGWRLRTRPASRPAHRRAVGAFVTATGLAIVTAGWMFLSARSAD